METTVHRHSFSLFTRAKVHNIGSTAKQKIKKALPIDSSSNDDIEEECVETNEYQAAMREINESPAFDSSRLLNNGRLGPIGLQDRAVATTQATRHFISSPKAALKTRAARKTAGRLAKSQPFLSKEADLAFLRAHDKLHEAEGSRDSSGEVGITDGCSVDVNERLDKIEQIEATRESMKVAWVTTRHVQRVRVIDTTLPPRLEDTAFEKLDEFGFKEFQWAKWFAYVGKPTFHGQSMADRNTELYPAIL